MGFLRESGPAGPGGARGVVSYSALTSSDPPTSAFAAKETSWFAAHTPAQKRFIWCRVFLVFVSSLLSFLLKGLIMQIFL